MFKFNFNIENDVDTEEPDSDSTKNTEAKDTELCKAPNEVVLPESVCSEKYLFKLVTVQSYPFFIRDLDKEKNADHEDEFLTKYYSACDVTPLVYEGGLKIWECTYDLMLYLIQNINIKFKNKIVLDLGCGSGVLGMYAAHEGAQTVHFHDYNSDVLRKFTIPNVSNNQVKSRTMFFAGDWSTFCCLESIQNTTYDYILSSEILYNPANYDKLAEIFSKKLNKSGKIFLASKTYYFGVGGSTKQFLDYLDNERKFEWNIVWKNCEGVQREIISIELRDNST